MFKFLVSITIFLAQNIFCMTIDDVAKAMAGRTVTVEVQCLSFVSKETKTIPIVTLDVCESSVRQIFKELLEQKFPIYAASCYSKRGVIGGSTPSLHAFGLAIDLNYLMNPYFDIINGLMTPPRLKDREEDRVAIEKGLREELSLPPNEVVAVLEAVIQEKGSDVDSSTGISPDLV